MGKRAYLIGGAAVAIALALIVIFAMRESAGKTAGAPGVVTAVELKAAVSDNDNDETVVTYRFDAGGQAVEGRKTSTGDQRNRFATGQVVNVCYNPERPQSSNIAPDGYDCGS